MNPLLSELGKIFLVFGVLMVVVGVILTFNVRIPGIGRLPDDIIIKRDGFTFCFPVVSCLIISLILSLLFVLFRRS